MLALLGWLGADIFWTLNAPESASPSAPMETDAQRGAQSIGVHVAAAAAAAPSNIRLNGVIAGERPGQRAYALITLEGKPAQLVREGEELAPGITLQRVLARQVELMRGGQSQTLALPEVSALPAPDSPKAAVIPLAEQLEKQPCISPVDEVDDGQGGTGGHNLPCYAAPQPMDQTP
jgi:hypothetical protein